MSQKNMYENNDWVLIQGFNDGYGIIPPFVDQIFTYHYANNATANSKPVAYEVRKYPGRKVTLNMIVMGSNTKSDLEQEESRLQLNFSGKAQNKVSKAFNQERAVMSQVKRAKAQLEHLGREPTNAELEAEFNKVQRFNTMMMAKTKKGGRKNRRRNRKTRRN